MFGCISPDERRLFLSRGVESLCATPSALTVTWRTPSRSLAGQLRATNPDIVITAWSTGELPRAWLEMRSCALRYVCHINGSVRRLVPRTFIERGGLVTNWGDIPASAVAEQALLLALAALRNLPHWPAGAAHAGDVLRRVETLRTQTLFRRRVGIHGFGRIARALLSLLRPFDVKLAAYSAGVDGRTIHAAGVEAPPSLEALFAQSEIVFECEALTPATARSVSANILAALPDGAVFVNVARGQLVDETALLREASTGRLRVALDVLAAEKPERERQRFQAAGAVLSPHIGGPTLDQYARCGEFAVQNIARFLRGESPQAIVTLADYDRAT